MQIEMNMVQHENKFSASSWWASSPEFVLYTLHSHLKAASIIWPELAKFALSPIPTDSAPTSDKPNGSEE